MILFLSWINMQLEKFANYIIERQIDNVVYFYMRDVPQLKLWVVCPLASESCVLVSHVSVAIEEDLLQVLKSPSTNLQIIQHSL